MRTLLLRLFGLALAAAVAAAALATLGSGIGFATPWLTDALHRLTDQLREPLHQGRTVLAGGTALVVALVAGFFMVRGRRLRLVDLGEGAGVEMAGISRMLERMLRARIDARATVAHRGRRLVVSIPRSSGVNGLQTAGEASALMPDLLESLGVGQLRFRVETGKTPGGRVA